MLFSTLFQLYPYFSKLCFYLGPYLPTILQNILSLVLHLAAFEFNTISDWLKPFSIWFNQSEVLLHSNLQNLGDKDRLFFRMVGEYRPSALHKIFAMPLAAFPLSHGQNNCQQREKNKS